MLQILTSVVPSEDEEVDEKDVEEEESADNAEVPAAMEGSDLDLSALPKANGKSKGKGSAEGDAKALGGIDRQQLLFCERFVEFMIDLMSQAPTRRYAHALLEDRAVLIKCRMSQLFQHEHGGWPPDFYLMALAGCSSR